MPEAKTRSLAKRRKSPSSKSGEYVREEIHHVRQGKHGARSAKQAIAIGLSKARKAGVKVPRRPGAKEPKATYRKPNPRRSRASKSALRREGSASASHRALSRHTKSSTRKRGNASLRRRAAQKSARTRGRSGRHAAAVKAARTRSRHRSR